MEEINTIIDNLNVSTPVRDLLPIGYTEVETHEQFEYVDAPGDALRERNIMPNKLKSFLLNIENQHMYMINNIEEYLHISKDKQKESIYITQLLQQS